MLQQSLEGLLIEGLQTSNVGMVRHCLRTYATIDKTRDAEALVGQVLVKPYMDQVKIPNISVCSKQSCDHFNKQRMSKLNNVKILVLDYAAVSQYLSQISFGTTTFLSYLKFPII